MQPCRIMVALTIVIFAVALHTWGAHAEERETPKKPPPKAVDNPTIPLEDLRLQLLPLTKEQLVSEAEGWLIVLQQKVKATSEAQIAGEDKAKIKALFAERQGIINRFEVVVRGLRNKGGDVNDYEAYIRAVTSLQGNVTNLLSWIWAWLTSPEGGVRWATTILWVIVALIVFRIISKILGRFVATAMSAVAETSELLTNFLANTVRNISFLLGIIILLAALGVQIGPFLAAIGAVGFIVAFALQGTLSNFASGVMIIIYQPYDIGHYVSIAGTRGTVHATTLVSTILKTPDNQTVVVPNSAVWAGIITNITGSDTRRVDMVFGISYRDDLATAEQTLEEIVTTHPLVPADPAPVVKMNELADSSINFIVRPWVATYDDYYTVYRDVTRAVKERFDAVGLSIPFPQRDIHMYQHVVSDAESDRRDRLDPVS